MVTRTTQLSRNFTLLFWIRAFLNLKVINVLGSLFFVARGLTLSELFYLTVLFSIVIFAFEVPSSYLADKWGRKKTLLLGSLLMVLQWVVLLFADNFMWFALANILFALSHALFTGTDEALIYDTNRELGTEESSLKRLGIFESARRVFKIATPILGAVIAKDLFEWQFSIIITIDLIASLISVFLVLFITEPNHYVDVEESEAGVFRDALSFFKKQPILFRSIFNRTIVFIATFIIWRFHQDLFTDLGVSLLTIGIGISLTQLGGFLFSVYSAKIFPSRTIAWRIDFFGWLTFIFVGLFVLGFTLNVSPYILVGLHAAFLIMEIARWPLFSEYYNKKSFSFNRATTLSLTNFVKTVSDIPLLFIVALLIGLDVSYPLYFALALMVIVFILPVQKNDTNLTLARE